MFPLQCRAAFILHNILSHSLLNLSTVSVQAGARYGPTFDFGILQEARGTMRAQLAVRQFAVLGLDSRGATRIR